MPSSKTRGNANLKRLPVKDSFKIFGRLVREMFAHHGGKIVLALICIFLSSGVAVVGNFFIGKVLVNGFIMPKIDPLHYGSTQNFLGVEMPLETAIIIMASIYGVGVISNYLYQVLVSMVGQGTQKKIRDELFAHMEKLPLSYFDTRTHGDIMSIYTNDIDTLREMISRVLPMLIQAFVTMIIALIFMAISSWILLLVVLCFFAIILTFVTKTSKKSSHFFVGQQRALGVTNGYIEEMITGQKVIKVFNHEGQSKAGFDELNESLCMYTTKASQFSNIMGPIVNNLSNLQFVVLALVGSLIIVGLQQGTLNPSVFQMDAGTIVSFLSFGKQFTMPIAQLSMNINMLIMAIAGAQRIFTLMDEKEELDEGYVMLVNAEEDENGNIVESLQKTNKWAWMHRHGDGSITYSWLKGKIDLFNVDFAYVKGKTVLHDISLYAKPGQKVAFVGPTGAGKTTITNLLNRFYDIEEGKIRFDDININKIKKGDLRKALGMVLQDTHLFTGTVRENIAYGNPDATEEEIIKAAELANADRFISLLPNGYDTVLTNAGAGLSQGQRQLLSIARAACANPPVLILDEATSSIDSRTERLVQKGMDAIMKDRTVFVIAHRLSTIQDSDVIMVLEDGHIIERGNHMQLMQQKGKYYQLYTGGKVSE